MKVSIFNPNHNFSYAPSQAWKPVSNKLLYPSAMELSLPGDSVISKCVSTTNTDRDHIGVTL